MSVLSFDIGLANLAVCVVSRTRSVEYIDLIDLRGAHPRDAVFAALEARISNFAEIAIALVEQQLKRKFAVIGAYVEMWVRVRFPPCTVFTYSARHKLAGVPWADKATYALRKKATVALVQALFAEQAPPSAVAERWALLVKKDDVADAICQALSYDRAYRQHSPPAARDCITTPS